MKVKILPTKPNTQGPTDEEKKKRFFLEKVARFCDKCGKAYELNDIEILQQNDYSTIIHFSCKACKARHVATFIRPLGITSRVPINTDLGIDEIGSFATRNSVTLNEVLDVHEILKDPSFTTVDLLSKA